MCQRSFLNDRFKSYVWEFDSCGKIKLREEKQLCLEKELVGKVQEDRSEGQQEFIQKTR